MQVIGLSLRVAEACFLISVSRRGKVIMEELYLDGFGWRFHVAGCKIPSALLRLLAMLFHIG